MNWQLYRLLGITACASNTLGFIANITAHGWSWISVFFGLSAIIIYIAFFIGERSNRQEVRQRTTLLMIVLTTLIEFPAMSYLYGAGRAMFCVFGVAVYVFFLKRPLRENFLIVAILANSAALILREFMPAYIAVETPLGGFITMLLSLIMVMIVTFLLLVLIRNLLDEQQESIVKIGEQVEEVLIHDALTGVYNRQYMYKTYETLKETNGRVVVALLDLDDFKQINDSQGHVYGDEVLYTFAKILSEKTEPTGTVFRYGGEEFLVLSGETEMSSVLGQLDEVRDALTELYEKKDKMPVTFSGGLMECDASEELDQVLKTVDARLYQAKTIGKNRMIFVGTQIPPAM